MSGYNILVTGGSGFLGSRIVAELLSPNALLPVNKLKLLDVKPYQGVVDDRLEVIEADLRDQQVVEDACKGVHAIIHSAAMVDWGLLKPGEIHDVNCGATDQLMILAQRAGVRAFLFTSSVDAIFTGEPLNNVKEDHPYPEHYPNMYGQSKSEAEQLVLAGSRQGFVTAAIRPADIWGENDPYHLDALFKQARKGMYVRLGDGKAKCQHVYVGNCAHAHVALIKSMLEGNGDVNGQSYFITDSPSENFFTFFDRIVLGSGQIVRPKNLWLPVGVALVIGAISEAMAWLWRPIRYYNPTFSRFAVKYTCTDYTFDAEKAQRDFGYYNKYEVSEAVQQTINYYSVEK